jgi:23S rRNA (guanine2445-N2)-methyltransferase / 23S rRNA (guanine2069-N7)-methyltransferase
LPDPQYHLVAACAFGLEAIVRRELQGLGIEASIDEPGRIHFRGTRETICQTNIWLRTADRVLIRVAQFPAADFDALFETVRGLPWGEFLPLDAAFPVTGRSIKSTLSSVPACQRAVKRAIVDALRRDHHSETLPETGAEHKVDVALLKDTATITIDTTGRSLHRRGYRTQVSLAPLKETLAAALVMLSYWKPGRPLIDPFCGSGTIPIEAARLGRNMAPGIDREFAAQAWEEFPKDLWADARQQARDVQLPALEEKLLGMDIDGRVLQLARENAARASVADDIHFQTGAMVRLTSRRRFGCLITNPPYGQRIDDRELEQTYRSIPEVLAKLPTWSHYFLTAYPGFERIVGRQADRRRKLYNGRIECTYFQFQGPKPVVDRSNPDHAAADSAATGPAATVASGERDGASDSDGDDAGGGKIPATRPYVHALGPAAFGQLTEQAQQQAELFAARLRKRAKHLRRWPTKRGITCYRLYERDVPEIPLVVDRYEDHLHISEYERPHDRDPAQHSNWLDLMARTAAQELQIPKLNVHLKRRRRQRGKTQHEKVDQTGAMTEVGEGGLRFLVNLDDYVDTGLFLDHRTTRQMVREAAHDATFLNLFSYTGSFTVYAAAGGARRTVSVDLSSAYRDWARQNMRLNGFSGDEHRFVASDVGSFIREHAAGEMYDLVVVDPPTFSNSKRTDHDWNLQTDCMPLLQDLLPLVRKGGMIFFSNNFRRFKFDPSELPASEVHEISKQTVPEDFRNRRIHRCWRIVK